MPFCKLEIFIPQTHFKDLQNVLQQTGAGQIGNYDSCLSYHKVIGTFRPLENAQPYIGKKYEINEEAEVKVEVRVNMENLKQTIEAIKSVHPYEEPVINVIPLLNNEWK